jgi:hypothetical protein
MNFIIFTNLEDTPIDEYIFDCIPENVLCISAVNAISYGKKVIPAPYGIQRSMHPHDDRQKILLDFMGISHQPNNLLYVNHNDKSNIERLGIKEFFREKDWAVVDESRQSYSEFLEKILDSKFVVCPIGNAIDCHRNWEVLYMRRVPVMKKHPYLQKLFENYPVLFVDKYSELSENLLIENDNLFLRIQEMDLSKLTLTNFFTNIINEYSNLNELSK